MIPGPSLHLFAILLNQTRMCRFVNSQTDLFSSYDVSLCPKVFKISRGETSADPNTQDDPVRFILPEHSEPFRGTWTVYYLLMKTTLDPFGTQSSLLENHSLGSRVEPVCISESEETPREGQ